jgi:hypothetical protein
MEVNGYRRETSLPMQYLVIPLPAHAYLLGCLWNVAVGAQPGFGEPMRFFQAHPGRPAKQRAQFVAAERALMQQI